MPKKKRVLINLPSELLKDAEGFASKDKCTLDEFVQVALEFYCENRKNEEFTNMMIKGYQEMAEINLQIAEEFIIADNEAIAVFES